MEKPSISKGAAITIMFVAVLSHFGSIFLDGLTIAKTQQQLSEAITRHPERYLQLSSNPLYQPLFSSYKREVELLNQITRARGKKDDEELAAFITRTKINLNPMFRNVLKAKDKKDQESAGRELFIQLARPAVDERTSSIYRHGRKLLSSMGFEFPELHSS